MDCLCEPDAWPGIRNCRTGTANGKILYKDPVVKLNLTLDGPIAQLAEQRTHNPRVAGSSPAGPTNPFQRGCGYSSNPSWSVPSWQKTLVPCIANRASFALDENGQNAFTSVYGIDLRNYPQRPGSSIKPAKLRTFYSSIHWIASRLESSELISSRARRALVIQSGLV